MLSPRNRMRHSAEFGSVMRSGRRASRDCLGAVYLPPPSGVADADPPRVGFVVSKAVGGAVVRKRVQRRLRHLMRSRLAVLPNGSLLVVRARPAAATARHEDLAAQLDSAIAAAMRPRGTSSRRRSGRGRPRPPAADPAVRETAGNRRPDEGGERWGR
ncbi:ribonuclease P protein component [Nocardiopsis akebiae]|uniref:Ribonuclease P protein component n=1 Tax=Nocardiopsis akebiae TaxID=2831968 RepID=A0ABX8C462_9ACTN|nr:ribonuclease P protein component [Nocardiopsis akebiae]QUX29176.1 ribonuclease P protein component [Nocardiopsis akebiae]